MSTKVHNVLRQDLRSNPRTYSVLCSTRINSVLNGILKNGLLTTEPARESQWAGVVVVRAVVTATLTQALDRGTRT